MITVVWMVVHWAVRLVDLKDVRWGVWMDVLMVASLVDATVD